MEGKNSALPPLTAAPPPLWVTGLAWWPLCCILLAFLSALAIYDPSSFVGDVPTSNRATCNDNTGVIATRSFPWRNKAEGAAASAAPKKRVIVAAVAVCQQSPADLAWVFQLCGRDEVSYLVTVYHQCATPFSPQMGRTATHGSSTRTGHKIATESWPDSSCIEHVWNRSSSAGSSADAGWEDKAYLSHILRHYGTPLMSDAPGVLFAFLRADAPYIFTLPPFKGEPAVALESALAAYDLTATQELRQNTTTIELANNWTSLRYASMTGTVFGSLPQQPNIRKRAATKLNSQFDRHAGPHSLCRCVARLYPSATMSHVYHYNFKAV